MIFSGLIDCFIIFQVKDRKTAIQLKNKITGS